MKKIAIVGLGLIGASYAMGLKDKYEIYGVDIDTKALNYAIQNKIISKGSTTLADFIDAVDIIIFSIYPLQILEELKKYRFKENQLVTDVLGVKSFFVYEASKLVKPAVYCSHHPMAGKEKVGIRYADSKIFKGANFLITPTEADSRGIKELEEIAKALEFGRIDIISPSYHDKMIGYTSTLTHAIAVALVNSDSFPDTNNFVGDSYRDLTRIAMINSSLWQELFFKNKENLVNHLDAFVNELEKIRQALATENKDELNSLFKESKAKRLLLEKNLNNLEK